MKTCRFSHHICLALILFVFSTVICAATDVTTTKVTYWESKTHFNGPSQYSYLDYFSSNPLGPHVQIYIHDGKSTVFYLLQNGIKWVIIGHTAKIDMPELVARIKVLIKRLGKKRVKQLSYWPVNEHDYPFSRRTFFQPTITTGMYIKDTSNLNPVRRASYLGHACLVLRSRPGPGDNGNNYFDYWVDMRSHMVWRVDYIFLPAPGNAAPPSRQTSRILWLKQIDHIPARLLRFPSGTRVIVPTCMGNIEVPMGGTHMQLPADAAFLGFSLKPVLASIRKLNPANKPEIAPNTGAAHKEER